MTNTCQIIRNKDEVLEDNRQEAWLRMWIRGGRWSGRHFNVNVLHSSAGVATQILISTKHTALLIDAGDGTLRDLLKKNLDAKSLSGILLTHGHFII